MKKSATDIRLIGGILLAHLFLYITFHDQDIFWYIYSAASLLLISYSIILEKNDDDSQSSKFIFLGAFTGIILYFIFMFGDWFISKTSYTISMEIKDAYRYLAPRWIWHYFVLVFILAPGEEIFWRGFVQKRIMRYTNPWRAIIVTSLFNASVFIYSQNFGLMIAAFFGGIAWGFLYSRYKNLTIAIMSHLIFDLLIIVVFPLY